MSVQKLGITLFSSFLILATAPMKSTASKDAGKTTTTTTRMSGESREKIRKTQTALKKEGFDPGPIDGIVGPLTMTALRNYQSHHGLDVTGTINAETENSLMGSSAANRRSSLDTTDRSPDLTSEYHPQANVSDREDVRQVQQYLADLYYNPGEINGMMSSETQQAIREFQLLNGLPVTGTIDEPTKISINNEWRGDTATAQLREKPTMTQEKATPPAVTKAPHKESKSGAERAEKAAAVLLDLTATADKRIPNEILERAEAIAVIPNMMKGAFGIGGRYGKGVVAQRLDGGRWSAPSYLEIGGGSFGAQIGVTSTDLVLVFTDRKALDLLEGGKDLKLGIDAGVAAGPIGRSAEAGVNANLKTAIWAYSRSKGLFAGVALDGAVLSIDKDMNEKVYGVMDAKQILDGKVTANTTVRPFMNALEKTVPKKRVS